MLGGLPNLQTLNRLLISENVPEMLQGDLTLEQGSQQHLKTAIAACEAEQDFVSREILVDILADTEDHVDHLETQLDLINKIGLQNFLQSQIDGLSE